MTLNSSVDLGEFHSQSSSRSLSVRYRAVTNKIFVVYRQTELLPHQYIHLSEQQIDDLITTLQYARHLQKEQDNGGVPGTGKTN